MSERRPLRCCAFAGLACLLLSASCATPIEIPNNAEARHDSGRGTPDSGGPADQRDGGGELGDMGTLPPPHGDAGFSGDAGVSDDGALGDGAVGDALSDLGPDALGDAGSAPDAGPGDASAAD